MRGGERRREEAREGERRREEAKKQSAVLFHDDHD